MALLVASKSRAEEYARHVRALDPALDVRVAPDLGDASEIDTVLAWQPPAGLIATLPNVTLVVSIGAGVDALLADPSLPHVPLVRFVDPDLTGRMVEYVTLHTLHHTRRMCEYREQQSARIWKYLPEPAAHELRVGIMGIGVLGTAAATALRGLGYQVQAWSRTPKQVDGIRIFTGTGERDAFLAETDILVVLLPLTPSTTGIIDRALLRKLSTRERHPLWPGPVLINAGRGGLQRDADILGALDAGELYAASLDVFQNEPLPPDSALWVHPRILVTPHNAAESSPAAIATYAVRQMRAHRAGHALENLVDRARGY